MNDGHFCICIYVYIMWAPVSTCVLTFVCSAHVHMCGKRLMSIAAGSLTCWACLASKHILGILSLLPVLRLQAGLQIHSALKFILGI